MNITGLSVITIIGAIMAAVGMFGLVRFFIRYRKLREADEQQPTDPDRPANTFAAVWLTNGLLHFGMFLLVLGGVGLIYYGAR